MAGIDWGDAPTWVGTAIALAAALFTWRQAKHAKASAHDATEALANAIRPIFAFTPEENESIGIRVTGQHPAVDVVARVTGNGGRVHGEALADRITGKVPGTLLGDADLVVSLRDLFLPNRLGESLRLTVTVRGTDGQGLRRWEQRGQITWEVRTSPQGAPEIYPVRFDQGEPLPYGPTK